jgi:hypothetical protein
VQRIGGDQDAVQVGQSGQGRGERGDLVALDHADLGEHQLVGMVVDADQLGLPAIAAQGLAVDGQHRTALGDRAAAGGLLRGLAAGEHPAGQRRFHRRGIQPAQQPPDRARVRRRSADGHRMVGDCGPVGDRRVGAGSGEHRFQRQQQHRLQAVTAAPPVPRVGHRAEGLHQRDRLAGRQLSRRQLGVGGSAQDGR